MVDACVPPSDFFSQDGVVPRSLSPGLYLVSTPIGNASDITLRALEVLRRAQMIACEDTRVTAKLCQIYGISASLVSYHDHNGEKIRPRLLQHIEAGGIVAQVSDAGMPGISDPGYKLVQGCLEAGLPVTVVPGPSAVLTGLVMSGLPPDKFYFGGFLPSKKGARQKALKEIKTLSATLVFFEAPHRILEMLQDVKEILGNRQVAVARELTKKFEEVKRGGVQDLITWYEEKGNPKGELVVIVDRGQEEEVSEEDIERALDHALQTLSTREAVGLVSEQLGVSRKLVYSRALLRGR